MTHTATHPEDAERSACVQQKNQQNQVSKVKNLLFSGQDCFEGRANEP
ncbi:hypothetical protein U2W12_13115 [Methylomicrobium sp. Wu6]|nr:hypothetical protein [Methylomicrobium sp. Wu6]